MSGLAKVASAAVSAPRAASTRRVAEVTTDARATAAGVRHLADAVALEAESLEAEVRRFLTDVQAA